MTPERAKELLPVIQAFAETKYVQSRRRDFGSGAGEWTREVNPMWCDSCDYQVEPEPREWWIAFNNNEAAVVLKSKDAAIDFLKCSHPCEGFHVIKVREVL